MFYVHFTSCFYHLIYHEYIFTYLNIYKISFNYHLSYLTNLITGHLCSNFSLLEIMLKWKSINRYLLYTSVSLGHSSRSAGCQDKHFHHLCFILLNCLLGGLYCFITIKKWEYMLLSTLTDQITISYLFCPLNCTILLIGIYFTIRKAEHIYTQCTFIHAHTQPYKPIPTYHTYHIYHIYNLHYVNIMFITFAYISVKIFIFPFAE